MKEALKVYGLGIFLMLLFGWGWDYFQEKPKLPEFAPNFTLVDLDGNSHQLEDYRGKRVVINFWASWCRPCIQELPAFAKFARNHPEIVVLGLSTDRQAEQAQAAANRFDLPYPILMAGEVAREYDIKGLPTTIIVDTDGRVDGIYPSAMSYKALRRAAVHGPTGCN